MAELERLANHVGDIGAICNDATFTIMHAQCGILREQVLRAADGCFGHRLMMDRITPGGVTNDLTPSGMAALHMLLDNFEKRFPKLIELYDATASVQDRTTTTGTLSATLARQFGAGGYIGRASGRPFDARKAVCYAPYDALEFDVPIQSEGDVNARVWIRIHEVTQSLSLIRQILRSIPGGEITGNVTLPDHPAEGAALIEAFRGDVFVDVRVGPIGILTGHFRDPSWFQWPLLEAVMEHNIVADFPLCNKSFNCSYSGHDL
jgi:Ni,Fe-hydrogenase III large subunit